MRRTVVAVLAVALPALAVPAGPPAETPKAAEVGPAQAAVVDDLPLRPGHLVWRKTLPGVQAVYAEPRVAGDRLLVAGARVNTVVPAKSYGVVFCLKCADGAEVWNTRGRLSGPRKDLKAVSLSTPFVADGRVYVGEGFHEDSHCGLWCLDAARGTDLWRFDTLSHTESSPVVAGGRVFFGAGDNGVYAADAKSGKELWNYPGLHIDAGPLVVGKSVYVGSGVGDAFRETVLLRLDAETGKAVWRRKVDLPAWGTPALAGDLLYFGIGNGNFVDSDPKPAGALLCVKAEDGSEVWRHKVGDGVLVRPVTDNSCVYFGSRDGYFYCLERRTGELVWRRDLGGPVTATAALARTGPARLTTGVYAVAGGRVWCLGPRSGRVLWSADLRRTEKAEAVDLSAVLATSADGKGETRRLYVAATLPDAGEARVLCFEDRLEADPAEERP